LSRAGTRTTRLAWFVGLWLASVLVLAVVASAIRWLILA
jgi:hypothetical protein